MPILAEQTIECTGLEKNSQIIVPIFRAFGERELRIATTTTSSIKEFIPGRSCIDSPCSVLDIVLMYSTNVTFISYVNMYINNYFR